MYLNNSNYSINNCENNNHNEERESRYTENHKNDTYNREKENKYTKDYKNSAKNENIEKKHIEKEVHISTSLSSKTIMKLIDEYPNLKRITCPKSIYNRVSKRYLEALKELGISVEIQYNWGKTKKYTINDQEKVIHLLKKDYSPKKIAEEMKIPLKSVYYLKDKNKNNEITLKRGKEKKYSYETRERIKKSANDGIPAKKIAEQENIPLRTIYYILKNG